jgi:signal transduction histidine kinase
VVGDDAAEPTAGRLAADHDIEATADTSVADALETLAATAVDCVVADARLCGPGDTDLLRAVRTRHGPVPFVLLTDRDEPAAARVLGSEGVDDMRKRDLVEDERYGRLAARIERAVARRRTRERRERLVEHSPDAVAHVAGDGTVLAANPAMADRLDTDRESLRGADLVAALPSEVGARRLAAGRRAAETGDPERTEDGYDGRSFRNVFLPAGVGQSFQFRSREVTERVACERALDRRDERLETLASVVSHDLRNPLNVAQTSLELLREDCATEDVDRIERSLVRMGDIIEDVLTLAREGGTVGDLSAVDLATAAADAWERVDAGTVTLEADVDRRIEADASRLRDLLGNLLANAVEHGGDVTTVTVGTTATGFYVADDGAGIPDDHAETVFDAGFSTARTGTGLGLAIVRDVARAHGWRVETGASETGGARFDVAGVTER